MRVKKREKKGNNYPLNHLPQGERGEIVGEGLSLDGRRPLLL
jgi:hypothetical protein